MAQRRKRATEPATEPQLGEVGEEGACDLSELEREQRDAYEGEQRAREAQQHAQDTAAAREARLKEMREHDAEQVLAHHGQQLEQLQRELAERRAAFDTLEAEEVARADTPLSFEPVVTSCNFATVSYPGGESIPRFSFPGLKCIQGKSRPDQDCRTCVEVKLIPYGQHLPPHRRRYLRHGLIFPLRTNEEADSIINVLTALGVRPLRNIRAELAAIETAIEQLQRKIDEERARDLQARQSGVYQ